MSSIATKRKLSGSTDGKGILVTHDATADAVAVHTAVAGTTAGTFDEVWLWAYNGHTANVILTVEFAGANHSGNIIQTIPFKSGLVPILPGLILQDAETIEAFAATENVIMLFGYVNAIADTGTSASATKRILSGFAAGSVPLEIAATATPGDLVHTAVAGTTAGTFDEVWIYAQNIHTADVVLTVEFGAHGDNIVKTIPFKAGLIPVIPGLILQNGLDINAFAATTAVVNLHGFINSITD